MEIDMDVNEQQAHYLLGQLLPKKLEFLGRWSEDVWRKERALSLQYDQRLLKDRMKVTLEVEINEELMNVVKEGMTKMHWKMPEMMKRGEEK